NRCRGHLDHAVAATVAQAEWSARKRSVGIRAGARCETALASLPCSCRAKTGLPDGERRQRRRGVRDEASTGRHRPLDGHHSRQLPAKLKALTILISLCWTSGRLATEDDAPRCRKGICDPAGGRPHVESRERTQTRTPQI